MTNKLSFAYSEIMKMDEQPDGSMRVYGKATDDSIDSDNQICDMGWLSKSMPTWFNTGGNIREQHSSIAAGVAVGLEAKSDGYYLDTLIVDDGSVKKLKAGVFKGFSIGIRGARVVTDAVAKNGRIVDGQIVEISLVDRPANPSAKLMLAKSDKGELVKTEEDIEIKEEVVTPETPVVTPPVEPVIEPVIEPIITSDEESAEAKAAKLISASLPVAEVVKTESDTLNIDEIIAKAVKSASNEFVAKFESQNAVIKTASETITKLQEELEVAKGKVANGGPLRTLITTPETKKNENMEKVNELRNKANSTTDKDLARGYLDLANDLEAQTN